MRVLNLLLIGIFLLLNLHPVNLIGKTSSASGSDSLHIAHYDVHLDILDFTNKKIQGHTRLTLTPRMNNVHRVELALFKLNVDSVKISGNLLSYTYNDTTIRFFAPQIMNLADTLVVDVYYNGVPKTEAYGWGGFHFNGTSSAYNLGIALEDRPPNYGRTWFACIDNFTDKSTYDFYIRVPDNLVAVCGGMLQEITPAPAASHIYHWKLELPVCAYLASVAVSGYTPVEGIFNGLNGPIPTQIYVRPQDTTKAKNSFLHLNDILAAFEYYFGPYRWPRVGYVATALGAMEHVTNVAYPSGNIDGTLNSEWLYAHELSHMWFGNLVTCASQEDMWINEGWAVFSEILFRELLYGRENYKTFIRKKHHDVLQKNHISEGGYLALSPIPSAHVYGSTVYDKGGMVTHSLRGYLGDSLFFKAVKDYLNAWEYKSINSIQLKDVLSQSSGTDLTSFFDAWVFAPGFPHFSIDSVRCIPSGNSFDVSVSVRQRTKGGPGNAANNHIPLRFMSGNWGVIEDTLQFSGKTATKTFSLPFAPVCTFLDPEETQADATTDNYKVIKNPGNYTFPDTYCSIETTQIQDSAFLRITHNWVAPDTFPQAIPGLRLSDYRYWTVEGNFPPGFAARGKFSYSKFNNLDNTLIFNNLDSLVLLYRKGTHEMWHSVPFTMNGVPYQGELIVDSLKAGEYTLAIWDYTYLNINELNTNFEPISVYPNPATGEFSVVCKQDGFAALSIFREDGALVDSIPTVLKGSILQFNGRTMPAGTLLLVLRNPQGKLLGTTKILVIH